MNRIVIGIDPGLDGAFVSIDHSTQAVEFFDMPTFQVTVGGKNRRQLDTPSIVAWLRGKMQGADEVCVVMEKQQAMPARRGKPCPKCKQSPSQGVVSTGTTMLNYGILLGIVAALEIPLELVAGRSWKAAMMKDMPSDKSASIVKAAQLVPSVADQLKRKKDHGRADALLIAIYGIRHRGVLADKPF